MSTPPPQNRNSCFNTMMTVISAMMILIGGIGIILGLVGITDGHTNQTGMPFLFAFVGFGAFLIIMGLLFLILLNR